MSLTGKEKLLIMATRRAPNPISAELANHRTRIKELNFFYWGVRAAFHMLSHSSQGGATTTAGFLPSDIGKHWSYPTSELPSQVAHELTRLRYAVLVQAVTFYEVFLEAVLERYVNAAPLPANSPKLQVDLSTAPGEMSAAEWIRPIYAKHVARDVLAENYLKRHRRVHIVLNIEPDSDDSAPDFKLVGAAGETRNCIIHAGGVVDKRAENNLKGTFCELKVGNLLVLTEEVMFSMIGAMKAHAEMIERKLKH